MKALGKKRFLLRFDDICPTMRWDIWSDIEAALIQFGIQPILAVVPDNQDPVLQPSSPVKDFWPRVRRWQELGWTIALHGYQHLYVAKHGGLVTLRKKSEFASLPVSVQRDKLRRGCEIFAREGIRSRVWIAPGNAFDQVTVSLLPEFGMDVISAGWFWRPFIGPHRMMWVPCQLSILRAVPSGAWSVCYHHNSWSKIDIAQFQNDLERYHDSIGSLDEILDQWRPWRAKWCYRFCTNPRISSLVLRVHLKAWKLTRREPQVARQSQTWPQATNLARPG